MVKGEWEYEQRTCLLAQMVQIEVQRGLVESLTFTLVKHSTQLYIDQRPLQQIGGSNHEARLAQVLTYHCLGAELDGSCLFLGAGELGYKCT